MEPRDPDNALRSLLAEREIRKLLVRYSRSLDTLRLDWLDDVFVPDAFIDMSSSGGPSGNYGALKAYWQNGLGRFNVRQHLLGQSDVEFGQDSQTATAITYQINALRPESSASADPVIIGGYYDDSFVLTNHGWRLNRRVWNEEWRQGGNLVTGLTQGP